MDIKLRELGFSKNESRRLSESLLKSDDDLKRIHKKMLEHLGILCLTSTQTDTLMWGYYAGNDGVCIDMIRRNSYTTSL